MAVVATLSKGYDLDYIWKQVDRGPAKDAASYYIQASESGGEPPGRWWGPGAKALGFEPGQRVERKPYDLLFGKRQGPRRHPAGQAPRRRPQSRRPVRAGCWPPSRTPPPDASTSSASKPPGKPGKAPCSST